MSKNRNNNQNETEKNIEAVITEAEKNIADNQGEAEETTDVETEETTAVTVVPRELTEDEEKVLEKYRKKQEKKAKVSATLKKVAKPAAIIGGSLAVAGGVILAIVNSKNGNGNTDDVEFVEYPTLPEDDATATVSNDTSVEETVTEDYKDYIV